MPSGRPSDYNDEVVGRILQRIADGQSVREICRDESMPCMSTVFRWLSLHRAFSEQYAKAKEAQAEYLAEEILDIADDGTNDWIERLDDEGKVVGYQVNGEAVQRSRLRVDTRKWVLSKLLPKKYGEFQRTEHSGPGGQPLSIRLMPADADA